MRSSELSFENTSCTKGNTAIASRNVVSSVSLSRYCCSSCVTMARRSLTIYVPLCTSNEWFLTCTVSLTLLLSRTWHWLPLRHALLGFRDLRRGHIRRDDTPISNRICISTFCRQVEPHMRANKVLRD